jgi:hypothetical protein
MRKVIDLECDLPPDENGNPRKIPGAEHPPGYGALRDSVKDKWFYLNAARFFRIE